MTTGLLVSQLALYAPLTLPTLYLVFSHGRHGLLALPLVEISVVYMLVAQFTQRADLNPTTGSLAVRVVLGFLPELLAALVLVFVGIVTVTRGGGKVGAEALELETWHSVTVEVTPAFAFATLLGGVGEI
ncbi:hypothetical protein ASPACDRAFT_40015 [Aspergillus aculeatus ATCC 16872]|uniref:Uncharacterized protein n=1 Tax=Aspergillus aculeatus (strain ATCC 16872 / CBS 172.66 / WB 5094) TaxID=690307 RepID=A0A1L9X2K2_ASPA1|nr:uncharacterized protein ASPACDRAFT_40015 [Aspergillus aculeatus ATCC 16872]OJK02702.1 hypothetical protein ASPACDRAFT_40015 [Aspergillus aculeatus ATCC 16872]